MKSWLNRWKLAFLWVLRSFMESVLTQQFHWWMDERVFILEASAAYALCWRFSTSRVHLQHWRWFTLQMWQLQFTLYQCTWLEFQYILHWGYTEDDLVLRSAPQQPRMSRGPSRPRQSPSRSSCTVQNLLVVRWLNCMCCSYCLNGLDERRMRHVKLFREKMNWVLRAARAFHRTFHLFDQIPHRSYYTYHSLPRHDLVWCLLLIGVGCVVSDFWFCLPVLVVLLHGRGIVDIAPASHQRLAWGRWEACFIP